jgi:DNA-binding MarR family transcriptional regulator
MSRKPKSSLLAELQSELRAYQQSVDALDEVAARRIGVNRSDLRCLDTLLQEGGATPTRLAQRLGLTSGSVTTMVDRLEGAGYAARSPDPADRRRVLVHPTTKAVAVAMEIYGPLATAGEQDTLSYAETDFRLLIEFFKTGRRRQDEQRQSLAALMDQS